ncbi:MAG: DUF4861 family protein, partial [Bacteroidota bacterium]
PFEFDSSDKNKMTGAYVAQEKLIIPNNLATQSKWIMFEGPVLENDRIAYRYYADSRHRFDIYAKSVTDLVMDTVSWNYHNIMDWGSDVLKVGNSLGIGSPAVWHESTLHTLSKSAKKELSIIENGDNKSTIRTTFTDLEIAGQKIDLIQDWSITAGVPYSTVNLKVTKGKLPEGAYFATGVVKHIDTDQAGENGDKFYAYTWGKQSFHKHYMGMAIFADKGLGVEKVEDELTHTYVFKNASSDEVEYGFLAAWELGNSGVKTEEDFQNVIKKFVK